MPQIQFIDRMDFPARCAENRRNSPGAVLGAGLDSPLLCIDICVALRSCDHAATSSSRVTVGVPLFSSSTHWGKLWRFHRCSSWTMCSRTVLAHRQGRRCASDQLIWLLFDIFIDFEIQFGRANAFFSMSSSPLDDDDGLFDDDQ